MRCSYFKVFYGDEANFLNDKITQDYMEGEQTFTAKVAIVQVGLIIDIFSRPIQHPPLMFSLADY